MTQNKLCLAQEIYQNKLSTIVFTQDESKNYWHYVAISRQTGKTSMGDKENEAKNGLIKLYKFKKIARSTIPCFTIIEERQP